MMRSGLVMCLGLVLSAGCGDASSDGSGSDAGSSGSDAGSGDATSACDDCPPGTSCVADECVDDEPDHWDCGGGAYCESGQIWFVPVGDDPDAEDPCAPSLQETCEHGCDESAEVDPYDDTGWCLPAPCSPEAQGLEGTPVDFAVLQLTCEESDPTPQPGDGEQPEPLVIATSAEVLAEAVAPCTVEGVDFDTHRVAVIRGWQENAPDDPSWVLEVDGTIHIEVTFQPFMSGIEVQPELYTLAVVLPAGETPVAAQTCSIPYDGPAVP